MAAPERAWARSPLVAAGVFVLLFAILDRIVLAGQPATAIPAWDLAGGLGLCFLALRGPRWAPLVLAVDLASHLLHPHLHPWPRLLADGLVFTLTVTGAAVWLRGSGGLRLERQSDLLRLVGAAGVAGAIQAGHALAWPLLAQPGTQALIDVFAESWIGMMLGALLVAPLLLSLPPRGMGLPARAALEAAAQAALLILVLALVYPPPEGDRFRYFYLLFLPLTWIAVRFDIRGVALANLLVQVWLIVFAALEPAQAGPLVNYKFRVLALTASGLFLAVAVSERRAIERALLERQEQLARVARLSLAGEMAAALAHQLNQPLAAAMAFAHAAQRRLVGREAPDSPLMQAIDGAVAEADRAGGIVRTLRTFVGRAEPERSPTSLDALVRDAMALAEPASARDDVRLSWTPPRPDPEVTVSAIEIQQVLLNLVQNAVDALRNAEGPKAIAISARYSAPGLVEVEVRDSGPGVAADVKDHLFEPFTSTKASGMGLGLLISRGIIESHGGRIWLAENEPGACAFRFTLPAGTEKALEAP